MRSSTPSNQHDNSGSTDHTNGNGNAGSSSSGLSTRPRSLSLWTGTLLKSNRTSDQQEPQITRYKDHFSLLTPTSTVRFKDSKSAARVVYNRGSQLVIEDRYHDPQQRNQRTITIKRMRQEGGGSLRLLRFIYILFAAFMVGFLFVITLQIIFFVLLDLVIVLGRTSLQHQEYAFAIGIILALPILLHGMSSAMSISGSFLIDIWKGHDLFNKFVFPRLKGYLVEWIFFLGFLGVPILVMAGFLFSKTEFWWENTAYIWFLLILSFFLLFLLNVLWYEARAFFLLLRDSDIIDHRGSTLGRLYECIMLRQRHSFSGCSTTSYMSFDSPETALSAAELREDRNKQKHIVEGTLKEGRRGLYARFTQWPILHGKYNLYKKLDQPKRVYSVQEVRQQRPYITTYTWSLERYFCRPFKSRYISIVKGPGALSRGQVISSFICSVFGVILIYILVAAVSVYMGSGTKFGAGVIVLVVCLSLPAAFKAFMLFRGLRRHRLLNKDFFDRNETHAQNENSHGEQNDQGNIAVINAQPDENEVELRDRTPDEEEPSTSREREDEECTQPHNGGTSGVPYESSVGSAAQLASEDQGDIARSNDTMDREQKNSLHSQVLPPSEQPESNLTWAGFGDSQEETSLGIYFNEEIYRITEPTPVTGLMIFALQFLLLIVWPTISLYFVENVPLSTLYLVIALVAALRYFTHSDILLQELGSLSSITAGGDSSRTWRMQSRLSEVSAGVGKRWTYYVWLLVYGIFTIAFIVIGSFAINATVKNQTNQGFTFLADFQYEPQNSVQYATCIFNNHLNDIPAMPLIDYLFLASQAYEVENKTKSDLKVWFNSGKVSDMTEIADHFRSTSHPDLSAAYYKLFVLNHDQKNHAVISVRGTVTPWDFLADFQLWSASVFLQGVRSALPFGFLFTPILQKVSHMLTYLQSGMINRVSFYKSTSGFARYLLESGNYSSVLITGHSLGAGLTLITGAQVGIQAVAFSAPNALIARKRFGISPTDLNRFTYNIIPERDPVAMVDDPAKTVTRIECRSPDNMLQCHNHIRTLCELMYTCGSGDRPVFCECVNKFGYPKPKPKANATRTFDEACLGAIP